MKRLGFKITEFKFYQPNSLMRSSRATSNSSMLLQCIPTQPSSLNSFIIRITLSVDIPVKSPKSARESGNSNELLLNMRFDKQSRISAKRPCKRKEATINLRPPKKSFGHNYYT